MNESAQGDQNAQIIPDRRGRDQAVLPGAEKYQQDVDNADSGLESCAEPLLHSVRRTDVAELTAAPLHKIPYTSSEHHASRRRAVS